MEHQQYLVDKGLIKGKDIQNFPFAESQETTSNLFNTIKEYRDYYQIESPDWENYIHEFLNILQFKLERVNSGIYKLGDLGSNGRTFAILAIPSPQDDFDKLSPGIKWGDFLFYVASYHKVKFGIVTNGLELKIFNFENNDFINSYFWVNLDAVIKNELGDYFNKLFSVFSLIKGQLSIDIVSKRKKIKKNSNNSSANESQYDLNYHLNSTQQSTVGLFERLRSKILSLSDSIDERYRKLYIGYSVNKNFCEIRLQKNRLQIWIDLCSEEISDPRKICRDMRKIGHYGTGETEFFLEKIEDLDIVFGLIEQSFNICIEKYGIEKNYSSTEGKMNKYQGLFEFLTNLPASQPSVTLGFSEIENLIGSKLPSSARKYRPWWANEKGGTHSQRLAWMEAGWLVGYADLENETVTFKKV